MSNKLSLEHMGDWVYEGRVFVANAGTATAPITFGAGSIDTTEPDLDAGVPYGTIIVPLKIHVNFETFGTTGLLEGMAAAGAGARGALTGGTSVTPVNLWNKRPRTSNVAWSSNVDASGATYQTIAVSEFFRFGQNKVVDIATAIDTSTDPKTTHVWRAKEEGYAPVIEGLDGTNLGRLNVFAGSVAGTGFIYVVYAEFALNELI